MIGFFAGHTLAPATGATAFVVATAALFLTGGAPAADKLNQVLTSTLLVLFALILGAGFLETNVPEAVVHGTVRWDSLGPALPIMFLSLVYHDLVPLICSYLGGDRKSVRAALLLGSLVPLGMFLSWEAVALAILPQGLAADAHTLQVVSMQLAAEPTLPAAAAGVEASSPATLVDAVGPALAVDPLEVFVRRSGPLVGSAVQGFSFLAVLTSFLGTVMGLSETLRSEAPGMVRAVGHALGIAAMSSYDTDSEDSPPSENASKQTFADATGVLALGLTLGPPLAFTAENPDAFLAVLSVAGGYGMTAMYGVLPPLMAARLRSQQEGDAKSSGAAEGADAWAATGAMLPGGAPVLAGLLVMATGVGLSRLVADAEGAVAAAGGGAALVETAVNAAASVMSTAAL